MKRILFILLALLLLIMPGCVDEMGAVNLSGQVDLNSSNTGWAYRTIASTDFRVYTFLPAATLEDFQSRLNLNKEFPMGGNNYLFSFRSEVWPHSRSFYCFISNLDKMRRVETIPANENDQGDPWRSRIDDPASANRKYSLRHSGETLQYFREPNTGLDGILECSYQINSSINRSVEKDGKFIYKDGQLQYDDVIIHGSSKIRLGFRQCLVGEKNIGKKNVHLYVLDWNFDGQFTEADRVWDDYTGSEVEFNKPIRLSRSLDASKDNTYRLRLIPPRSSQEKFILNVELLSVGVRSTPKKTPTPQPKPN